MRKLIERIPGHLARCNAALPGPRGVVPLRVSARKRCLNPRIDGLVLCAPHAKTGGTSALCNGAYVGGKK